MKTRYSVIASALALAILVVIQYYNISVTYQTQKDQFDTRYGTLVKQALYDYQASSEYSDSAYLAFDILSEDIVFSGLMPGTGPEADSLRSVMLNSFSRILQYYSTPDGFLAKYLENAGADPDFRSGYFIRELYLLDYPELISVFRDTTGVRPLGLEMRCMRILMQSKVISTRSVMISWWILPIRPGLFTVT